MRDAFGSISHELLMLMMGCLGFTGGILDNRDTYFSVSSVVYVIYTLFCEPVSLLLIRRECWRWEDEVVNDVTGSAAKN